MEVICQSFKVEALQNLILTRYSRNTFTPCITTHVGCLLCVAWGVCKYCLKRTKWWVNFRYLLKINKIPPKSLLQSTLELSGSTCIANKVESDQYFSQTPPASFLRSCKILRFFSLRVNLLCFPRSPAIVLSSDRYEPHFQRLFYARKWISTAHLTVTDKVRKTLNV